MAASFSTVFDDSDSDEEFYGFPTLPSRNNESVNFSDIEVSSVSSVDLSDSDSGSDEDTCVLTGIGSTWSRTLSSVTKPEFTGPTPGAVDVLPADSSEAEFFGLFFPDDLVQVSSFILS